MVQLRPHILSTIPVPDPRDIPGHVRLVGRRGQRTGLPDGQPRMSAADLTVARDGAWMLQARSRPMWG